MSFITSGWSKSSKLLQLISVQFDGKNRQLRSFLILRCNKTHCFYRCCDCPLFRYPKDESYEFNFQQHKPKLVIFKIACSTMDFFYIFVFTRFTRNILHKKYMRKKNFHVFARMKKCHWSSKICPFHNFCYNFSMTSREVILDFDTKLGEDMRLKTDPDLSLGTAADMLGLEDRDSLSCRATQGAYMSYLLLRHLRIRDLQRTVSFSM